MSIDVDGIKQGQRRMWASGDYPDVARRIEPVAEVLVASVGAGPGLELLDVATGNGNVAIAAAQTGANVTGLDITPELLEAARRRASESGVQAQFIEGDAEQLPFEDDSFDIVTSCFGVMFAPQQAKAAGELVRVARPGATIAVSAWTPEGLTGRLFKLSASYMPPPPPELTPPVMWGVEGHVRSLFADSGADVACERRMVTFASESAQAWVDHDERVLGPMVMAKAALEPQGRWQDLKGEVLQLFSDANEADEGAWRAQAEYLLTVVRTPA